MLENESDTVITRSCVTDTGILLRDADEVTSEVSVIETDPVTIELCDNEAGIDLLWLFVKEPEGTDEKLAV